MYISFYSQGFQWLEEKDLVLEKEERLRMESVLYALAMKFLTTEELTKVKGVIAVTELGRMLRNDGIEIGKEIGEKIGEKVGEEKLGELTIRLLKESRLTDLQKAAEDSVYRKQLYREYGIGVLHEAAEDYQIKEKGCSKTDR